MTVWAWPFSETHWKAFSVSSLWLIAFYCIVCNHEKTHEPMYIEFVHIKSPLILTQWWSCSLHVWNILWLMFIHCAVLVERQFDFIVTTERGCLAAVRAVHFLIVWQRALKCLLSEADWLSLSLFMSVFSSEKTTGYLFCCRLQNPFLFSLHSVKFYFLKEHPESSDGLCLFAWLFTS